MSNKIKCEWCGCVYDVDKFSSCPKCGGTNNEIVEPKKIQYTSVKNTNTNNSKTNLSNGGKILIIILSILFGLPVLSFIILVIIGMFVIPNEKDYTYENDDTFLENSYDYTNDSYSDYQPIFGENEVYDNYYVNYDKPIELPTGGKLAVPFISIYSYKWKDDYVSSSFSPYITMQILESDYNSHDIEFYLVRDGVKIRVADEDYAFNNSNINSLNDIFKGKKELVFYGKCSAKAENFEKITKLIVSIDGKEYEYDLSYQKDKRVSYYDINKDYIISEKINLGDGNTINIDSVQIQSSSNSYTYMDLNLSTTINKSLDEKVRFFLEDSTGKKYEMFIDYASGNVSSFDDLLKLSYSGRIYSKYYWKEITPTKFDVEIGTNSYSFDIK